MESHGKVGRIGVLVFLVCCVLAGAESLYVSDHGRGVYSFDIIDNQFVYRHSLDVPNKRGGGVDLAIDDEFGFLFRNVEFGTGIDIIGAQSLTHIKTVDVPVMTDAGIIYDSVNQRLICAERNSPTLHILLWEPSLQTLTLQVPSIQLSHIQHACDLAINGDILYVSEYLYGGNPTSQIVYAYDMADDFAYIEQYDMGDYVVAMDYNALDDSIYGTCWFGSQYRHIIKRSFGPNTVVKKEIDFNAIGVASSTKTADRIFTTSYRPVGGGIELWDMSGHDPNGFTMVDEYTNDNVDGVWLSGLAGLVVGKEYIVPQIELDKYDNVEGCVEPYQDLTYTLWWENLSSQTAYGVWIIDYLPRGVTYPQGAWTVELGDPNDPNQEPFTLIPPDPGYHADQHAYVWHIGDIGAEQIGYVELTGLYVNEKAEPGMTLYNKAVLTSSLGTAVAELHTPVCCWDTGTIIYVDKTATGNDTGVSWQDAYTDLQRALARARETTCQGEFEIWVAQAQEAYSPGMHPLTSFELPDGVSLYGGFPIGGSDFLDRNPQRYKTILTGETGNMPNHTVVKMGNGTLLDGFTVTGGALRGIYGSGSDFVLERCVVENNQQYGIFAENGNVTVKWCYVENNGWDGIRHIGNGKHIHIENCHINYNRHYGLYLRESNSEIKNSIICRNGRDSDEFFGIWMFDPTDTSFIYNNTIAYNYNQSIGYFSNDPNHPNHPDIQNCILWYNNNDEEQLIGNIFTQYSCVYDPNDSDGEDFSLDAYGNFSGNPGFAYTYSDDPNVLLNVHLAWDSPCRSMGNPYLNYEGQYDMDGEPRVFGGRVDIGADEVHCEDIYNPFDWNADGVVNLREFALISRHWLAHDPNDPAIIDPNHPDHDYLADPNSPGYINESQFERWNSTINVVDVGSSQYRIDLADLLYILDQAPWLWVACWNYVFHPAYYSQMAMGSETESLSPSIDMILEEPFKTEDSLSKAIRLNSLEQAAIQILVVVEQSLQEEHYNHDGLLEMRDFLYQCLLDIHEQKN